MFACVRVVTWRRVSQIEAQFEGLFDHIRDYPVQKRVVAFETWIRVDFDQPRLEVTVNHEI